MDIIRVDNLQRRFRQIEAVKGVSFSVGEGEVFGFLGPNGAGKTTTINMLCTLLRPTGGGATVNGFDILRQRNQVRRSIGLVFEHGPGLGARAGFRQGIGGIPGTAWRGFSGHEAAPNIVSQTARSQVAETLRYHDKHLLASLRKWLPSRWQSTAVQGAWPGGSRGWEERADAEL